MKHKQNFIAQKIIKQKIKSKKYCTDVCTWNQNPIINNNAMYLPTLGQDILYSTSLNNNVHNI